MSIKQLEIAGNNRYMPRAFKARGVLYVCLLLFTILISFGAKAKQASLITAWPGREIYELCGHEAIRISGDGIDSVWNFGVFNFNEPNFVYRFVKGETDYMVDSYPFSWFMPEYVKAGRRVDEQVLNLTPEEVDRLHNLLRQSALPPNNRYRYNYIKNNCSTKIASLLDSVAGGNVIYSDTIRFANYRDAMRAYHTNYPWYQFGIDLALGSGLEEELSQKEELFIPTEFYRHAYGARLPDGRNLVASTRTLYEGRGDAVDGPTPFLLTPLWFSIVIAALTLIILYVSWRKNCIPKFWYTFYFALAGLAGCLIAFLVCVSSHAATSPNLLIFWLNPLQLLIPVCLWWRATKIVLSAMMWLNLAAVGMLIVIMPIFSPGQGREASFLILMATDIILAAYYLYAQARNQEEPEKIKTKKKQVKNSNRKTTNTKKKKPAGIKIRQTTK